MAARASTSPASPAPRPCWPGKNSASRSTARWRIPSSSVRRRDGGVRGVRPRAARQLVLLIDTYDTEAAARKSWRWRRGSGRGIAIRGVARQRRPGRARGACAVLDAGGLSEVTIFASGGLDEDLLAGFTQERADRRLGIGTSLTISADVPALDCVYKLQEYAGMARRKRSEKKPPGRGASKSGGVTADGRLAGDFLAQEGGGGIGEPLIQLVMQGGRRLRPSVRSTISGGAPSASLNGCPSPCAGSSRARPIRSRSPTNWWSLRRKSIAASRRRCRRRDRHQRMRS